MSGHHHQGTGNIKTAFFLNSCFAVIELVGGIYTNSIAIISDALHDLGDSLSLGLAWYFQKISDKEQNRNFTFGFKRFNVLGAIINAVVLTVGSVLIISEAVPRLFNPVMPDAKGMMYLAGLGIIVNGVAAFRMRGGHTLNERVVYIHLLEDVLGWLATLIVSIVLIFRAVPILDPVLSILVSAYILYNVYKNLKSSLKIILQATPVEIDIDKVHESILGITGVDDFHDCHLWTMDGHYHVLSGHVVIGEGLTMDNCANIKKEVKSVLADLDINHSTIEFETPSEDCHSC